MLADKSSDEAGCVQLSEFVPYFDNMMDTLKENLICNRQLSTAKIFQTLIKELENMLKNKFINKTLIKFSGSDATNAMSSENKGLKQRFQRIPTYKIDTNCRTQRPALCLVHLLETYINLEAVGALLMSIWKAFHYKSIKQAIYENAELFDGMNLSKSF